MSILNGSTCKHNWKDSGAFLCQQAELKHMRYENMRLRGILEEAMCSALFLCWLLAVKISNPFIIDAWLNCHRPSQYHLPLPGVWVSFNLPRIGKQVAKTAPVIQICVCSWTSNQSWVFSVVCQPSSKYVFCCTHLTLFGTYLRHIVYQSTISYPILPARYTRVNLPERSLRSCSLLSGKWPNKSCLLVYCWTRVYIMNLESKWPLYLKVNPPKQGLFPIKTRVIWVPGTFMWISKLL